MSEDDTGRVRREYEGYARSPGKRRKWDRANSGNVRIRAELFGRLRKEIGDRLETGSLLDVGCGTGWFLGELARHGTDPSRLHGVDLLDARVSAARGSVPGARIEAGDARDLASEDDTFDVVTMICLLSSLGGEDAVEAALAEALRVLRPGGLLTAYEPRRPNPLNRNTHLISDRTLQRALGSGYRTTALTVLPPLTRVIEPAIGGSYERLARISPLLTHRLITYVAPQSTTQVPRRRRG
jgi:ubiquinone/menaquinone biosynthesis C-methylase UbiE